MFEINTSEEFSTSQQQKAFNSNSTFADSPIAYGLEAKQENLIASSLSDLQENESSNQVNGFEFQDLLESGGTLTASDGSILIEGGSTTTAEINEVNDLLDQDIYDRDQVTGDRDYTNYTSWWSTSTSANEKFGYDRTDSRSQAVDIGEIVYRSDANVDGYIGYGSERWGGIDKNDYFKFSVGKEGTIDLTLSGLSNNIGLALYSNSGSLLDWSDKSGTRTESIEQDLDVGNYYARVYSYKSDPWNHGATSYDLNISRQADALETSWEAMLTDSSLKNAALNSIKYDNELSRNDVIGILKSTADYGNVNTTEFNNLQTFYNEAINTDLASEHVQVLAEKVLFEETSNQWYTGSDSVRDTLGNLAANSSDDHLNLLIGKHFLGTDRPASGQAGATYQVAGGELFKGPGDGISAYDIDQGNTGTCYFLGSLAATANDKPSLIEDMFTDNGDDTWSVRFYTSGKTDYVTVDKQFLTCSAGKYIYADDGAEYKQSVAGDNELWVALAEKAYAQVNESGNIGQETATNYYGIGNQWNTGISWGYTSGATRHITGLDVSSDDLTSFSIFGMSPWGIDEDELIGLVNGDNIVTVGGFDASVATGTTSDPTLVTTAWSGHVWSLVDYNGGLFTLLDPYGNGNLTLDFDQLDDLDGTWSFTTT